MPRTISEGDIESVFQELIKSSEEWRALKLVVLGNGRIGKITLIRAIKQQLNNNINEVRVLILFHFSFWKQKQWSLIIAKGTHSEHGRDWFGHHQSCRRRGDRVWLCWPTWVYCYPSVLCVHWGNVSFFCFLINFTFFYINYWLLDGDLPPLLQLGGRKLITILSNLVLASIPQLCYSASKSIILLSFIQQVAGDDRWVEIRCQASFFLCHKAATWIVATEV